MATESKFTFSSTSFELGAATAKNKFKTSDYIYGRVELPQTVKDFFDTDSGESRDKPHGILMLDMQVLDAEGTQLGAISPGRYIKPSSDQLNNKYLNFDVSPEPSKATTLVSLVSRFDVGHSSVPSAMLYDQSNYYGRVPNLADGATYTVEVTVSRWTFDPYSPSMHQMSEKWSKCIGRFELEFNGKDIPTLIKNNKAADALVTDNLNKKEMASRGLPKEWSSWNGTNATGHTEKQLIEMFLSDKPGSKIFKVVYEAKPAGPLWDIRRNNGVAITERHCMQLVGVFAQVGGKCTFNKMGVRETYLGGEKYDVANAWMQPIERVDVDCKFIPSNEERGDGTSISKKKAKPEKNAKTKKK